MWVQLDPRSQKRDLGHPDSGMDTPALPFAVALHLADLTQVEVALEGAHAEDEQHAVHVVDLMLKAAREQVFAVPFEPLAELVLGANADLGGADDLFADVGEAEAALLLVDLAVAEDDLGIDENQLVLGVLAHAQVDGGEALGHAHLWRGQAHALIGIGGLKHVGDQLAQLIVEVGHGFAGS